MTTITIVTLFPKVIEAFLDNAIIKRAIDRGVVNINVINLRDYSSCKHKSVDDAPYGGGAGMVIKKEAIDSLFANKNSFNIFTSPQGELLDNNLAKELAQKKDITILCGHYEGIDERAVEDHIDLEISIGNYVMSGGELASLVIADSILRFIPGVIRRESYENDSFEKSLLDHASYTRPYCERVPKELVSGNHSQIELYRKKDALYRTVFKKPNLLKGLSLEEKSMLRELLKKVIKDID